MSIGGLKLIENGGPKGTSFWGTSHTELVVLGIRPALPLLQSTLGCPHHTDSLHGAEHGPHTSCRTEVSGLTEVTRGDRSQRPETY